MAWDEMFKKNLILINRSQQKKEWYNASRKIRSVSLPTQALMKGGLVRFWNALDTPVALTSVNKNQLNSFTLFAA